MALLLIATVAQADDFYDEVDYFIDNNKESLTYKDALYNRKNNHSWFYDEVKYDESRNNEDLIEQVVIQTKKPPYEKKEIFPGCDQLTDFVVDFVRKTKSFFSMKGIKTKTFEDVIGPDRRPANETYLWEYFIKIDGYEPSGPKSDWFKIFF